MSADFPSQILGLQALFEDFEASSRTRKWSATLRARLEQAFDPEQNGHLAKWTQSYQSLPDIKTQGFNFEVAAITTSGSPKQQESAALQAALFALSPWRKGPYQIFDTFIDTEWRSNLKWQRLSGFLDLVDRDVLDVGCGNGYYGWRMIGGGAKRVVGLDPSLLYVMQFAAIKRYLPGLPNFVLPAGDTDIPLNLRLFDTVFSMGVLYHRKSPIEHLQSLYHAVRQGGDLVLETLVIPGDDHQVLIPQDRYAMMKNVWFFPTCALLERMVKKCGFTDVRIVDVAQTTVDEQRSTDWMTYDSLPDFLDPDDHSKTVEGYPAPLRAVLLARRP